MARSVFEVASAVVPDPPSGPATDDPGTRGWATEIDPTWSIGGRANGGYLLAAATRAALAHLGTDLAPLAVTGAFAAAAVAGPARLETELLRSGRTTAVVRARLVSGGQTCLEALVTAGTLGVGDPVVAGPAAPDLPPRDACYLLPSSPGRGMNVPILDVLHQRLDPATLGFGLGNPSGAGELRGWLEMADGTDFDPLALVMAVDCYPPAVFELREVDPGWVPTLQLSAFVRAAPAPGPLRVRTLARSVGGGMVDETTDVWDSTGRLVAVGHQLAAVRLRRTD